MSELDRYTQPAASSVTNPEQQLQTYHVYLLDTKFGNELSEPCLTHHYSIEECYQWLKETLDDRYQVLSIRQPDSNLTVTKAQFEEL